MNRNVIRLYPASGETVPLKGLYLRQELPALGNVQGSNTQPHVYANFLTSLQILHST